jgi:Mce-associated membrane protein
VTTTTDIDEPDTEVEPDAETADKGTAEEPSPRRWPRLVRRGLLWALISCLLGASGLLGWQVWQQRQINAAAHDAQQAAVHYAQVLTSIDSNNVDQNFNEVLNGATGEFKDMYSQSSAQLRQLLVDNKASAHGVVVDSAVQSASKDKVVVLLFVDQTVSNTAAPDPRIDRSRVKMTLEKVDGAWRASKVQLP